MKTTLHLSQTELIRLIESGTLLALARDVEAARNEEEAQGARALDQQTAEKREAAPETVNAKNPVPQTEESVRTSLQKGPTLDELRREFQEFNTEKNRPKLKDILHRHGAKSLSGLPQESYTLVWDELQGFRE